ncbi:MAG: O-antigen ligase family protein [Candidatus Pacebacteria bacterium]|nr:O-antigen ligase family protein [Candidatus Paceibacterota bacterium]
MSIHQRLKSLAKFIDNNIILILGGFLIAFIPLYPKIPLFSPIEEYIVRVRLEDIFILITVIIWAVQVFRKKIKIHPTFFKLITGYGVIGLLSVLSAIFIIKTVPIESIHIGKTLLHYFRYLEYFSLFFVLYSAIKSKKDVQKILTILILTTFAIALYGFGQRYYYWPVYSTMNREFSKGIVLYLTEHARVQSTFAGHYDLAAWLVIVLPIILTIAFKTKEKVIKIIAHLAHWLGLWLLIESAARSSFAAYIVAVTVVVLLLSLQRKKILNKIFYFLIRYLFIGTTVLITMIYFGGSMAERLLQVVESYPQVAQSYDYIDEKRVALIDNTFGKVFQNALPQANKPNNGLSTDEAVQIIVSSDTRPVTQKPDDLNIKDRPSDVYVDVPDYIKVATISATGETSFVTVERERTYSDNALKYGLSLAIRLDTLWPQAIKGFYRSPLLGSGYATLNKGNLYLFTEADGVDNNFLRTLGETGLLGIISFYGTIFFAMRLAIKSLRNHQDELLKIFAIGYFAGSLGLLINATYIDVYAASKVAFSYWAITGVFVAYYTIIENKTKLTKDFVIKKSTILDKKKTNSNRKQLTFKNSTTPKKRRKKS